MAWNFKRESTGFSTRINEGSHRIRIKAADKTVSKSGNDMLVLQFDVSGHNEVIYHYIVFLQDHPEITNRNLTQFFDAFEAFKDLNDNEIMDMSRWIGKVGACVVKHEEYNGTINAKVDRFIPWQKQEGLPAWVEVDGNGNAMPTPDANGFIPIPPNAADQLPF